MVCEVVQRMHDAFMGINDEIGQFDWYLYSNVLQRMLLIIIIDAQHPIKYRCFGSLKCNRELFKTVKFNSKSNVL